ncbi:uncharacterized protein LOC141849221 isoform X2 [Brevipalpus obovatus]|uniref:uncharacterized protein LOC141849221 isoform X2 n=1 Tax=Brevipalpus obovatus TaxID=246614 RepID=UPI003D9F3B8E
MALKILLMIIHSILLAYSVDLSRRADRPQKMKHAYGRYRTATACENSILEIECEPETHINLIRANFGRFSIQTCNEIGNNDLKVDCMSPKSFRVMEESCGLKQSCVLEATSANFGDPCPGTPKYLEAHYQCLPDAQKKRYRGTSRPSQASRIAGRLIPNRKTSSSSSSTTQSPSQSFSFSSSSTVSSSPSSPLFILTTSSLPRIIPVTSTSTTTTTTTSPSTSKQQKISPILVNGQLVPQKSDSKSTNDNANDVKVVDTTIETVKNNQTTSDVTSNQKPIESSSTSPSSSTLSSPSHHPIVLSPSASITSETKTRHQAHKIDSDDPLSPANPSIDPIDERPIYIKHPHPGSPLSSSSSSTGRWSPGQSSSSSSSSSQSKNMGNSQSNINIPIDPRATGQSQPTVLPASLRPSMGDSFASRDDVDTPSIGSSSGHDDVDSNNISNNRTPASMTNPSWWSSSAMFFTKDNLVPLILLILLLLAIGLGVSIVICFDRDDTHGPLGSARSTLKNNFISLTSAINAKLLCSRNVAPMGCSGDLSSKSSTGSNIGILTGKRSTSGFHPISVTASSRYLCSENAAHYIRDPIIGPNSGSTLNPIRNTLVPSQYLMPSTLHHHSSGTNNNINNNNNVCLDTINTRYGFTTASIPNISVTSGLHSVNSSFNSVSTTSTTTSCVVDPTYGCSQLLQPAYIGLNNHSLSQRSTLTSTMPLDLIVEHVYECIDDEPYTAKLFLDLNKSLQK